MNESVLTAGGKASFTMHLTFGTLIWRSVSPRTACRRCWREWLSVRFVLLSVWATCSQAFVPSDGFYGGKFAFDTFSYLRVSLNNPSWYVYSHDIQASPQTHSYAGSTRSSASASLLTRYAFCLCTPLPTGISRCLFNSSRTTRSSSGRSRFLPGPERRLGSRLRRGGVSGLCLRSWGPRPSY